MAEYTQNYSLKKPLPNEFYDVADQNSNMDKIDSALKKHDDLLDKKVDLDETGKIPQEQLPELDFIKNSEKGQPNGVPILDEHGKIPADNMPANTPTLGEDGKIPQEQLPDLNFDTAGSAAAVQGNLNAHINNKQNPHGVTAAQVGAYDKNQSLTSVTAGLFGLSASAVPNDVLAKIKTLIDSANNNANTKCKIQRGTYVGTGTYGSSTPNILNFNFQPYVVVITGKREVAICNCTEPKSMAAFSLLNNGSGCYGCDTKVSGNQLTWWFYANNVAGNEIFQMNSSGETYTYTVIGY